MVPQLDWIHLATFFQSCVVSWLVPGFENNVPIAKLSFQLSQLKLVICGWIQTEKNMNQGIQPLISTVTAVFSEGSGKNKQTQDFFSHKDWPVFLSEGVIQNSSRWRCAKAVPSTGVEGGADALLDHNEDQLGLVAGESLKAFDQLGDLVLLHHHQLTIWHTIPIHHNLLWQVVVHLYKRRTYTSVMSGVCVIKSARILVTNCLCQPFKLQFTSRSVQTRTIYVVKPLKEFSRRYFVYFGKMEDITILTCMIPINSFQWET